MVDIRFNDMGFANTGKFQQLCLVDRKVDRMIAGIVTAQIPDLGEYIIDSNTDKRVPGLSHFCRGNQTR